MTDNKYKGYIPKTYTVAPILEDKLTEQDKQAQLLFNPHSEFPTEVIVQIRSYMQWCYGGCNKFINPYNGCPHNTPLKKCQVENCITWIPGGGYCDNHKSSVASSSSSTYSSYSSYSYSSPSYTCQVSGCYTSVSSSGSYCSSHQNSYCVSCSATISRGQTYCNSHANNCNRCSTRIASGQSYCSEHQPRLCLTCQEELPYRSSFFSYSAFSYSDTISPNDFCSYSCAQTYANTPWWARNTNPLRTNNNPQTSPPPTEQDRLKALVKQRTSISGDIKEVVRFGMPGNNNLATVINKINNEHGVYLVLYDGQIYVFPTNPTESKWGNSSRSKHNSLASAQSEANWLRGKLQSSSNPILEVHSKADEYNSFSSVCIPPYVRADYNASQSDFKPLDIVWVRRWGSFHHVGIYLGNGEVIHLSDNQGVEKTSWSSFLKKGPVNNDFSQEIFRFHPIIPFKDYKDIIAQLVWAKDNEFRKGNYNIKNRNCEHFANMAVLGINYSQQIAEKGHLLQNSEAFVRGAVIGAGAVNTVGYTVLGAALAPFTGGASILIGAAGASVSAAATASLVNDTRDNPDFCELNNSKGSTIKLVNEINETNGMLGKKKDSETRSLEGRFEQSIPSYIPTDNCRIM